MCTVVEICSTGVRVTLSDVPEVLLTATNSELPVQDAGLAAKAGTLSNGIGHESGAVFLWATFLRLRFEVAVLALDLRRFLFLFNVQFDSCATG
jgi:hypothetical protein